MTDAAPPAPLSDDELAAIEQIYGTHDGGHTVRRLIATIRKREAERNEYLRQRDLAEKGQAEEAAKTLALWAAAVPVLTMGGWILDHNLFGQDDQPRLAFEDALTRLRDGIATPPSAQAARLAAERERIEQAEDERDEARAWLKAARNGATQDADRIKELEDALTVALKTMRESGLAGSLYNPAIQRAIRTLGLTPPRAGEPEGAEPYHECHWHGIPECNCVTGDDCALCGTKPAREASQ